MKLFELVVPLGLTTYLLVFLTLITGLTRAKLSLHKLLAAFTIILASCHAGLVIYLKLLR